MTLHRLLIGTILLGLMPWSAGAFNNSLGSAAPSPLEELLPGPAPTKAFRFFAGKGKEGTPFPKKDYRIKTVVIDPGHGGHDPGCQGRGSQEKHLALAIAQQLAKKMQTEHPDLQVILTRNKDVFVPLHERAQIANRHGADLFISIHCNYFPNRESIRGSETYVMGLHTAEHNLEVAKRENAVILLEDDYEANYDFDPNSPTGHIMLSMFQNVYLEQSIRFAEQVERHIEGANKRPSRGVKQAGFVVLKETAMPSVLIETGFLSNRVEERYLKSAEGQQQVARAISDAFSAYRQEIDGPVKLVAAPTPERSTTPAAPPPSPTVTFCVQLAASPSPLNTQGGQWKNLAFPIQTVREDGYYRYQARNFPTLEDARAARNYFQNKGFSDAFIVAYRNGKKIPLDEVR